MRELVNAVDSALAMEPAFPILYPKHLPEYIRVHAIGSRPDDTAAGGRPAPPPLDDANGFPTLKGYRAATIEQAERRYIAGLMARCRGDLEHACRVSGLKRARLYQLLKKYAMGRSTA